MRCGIVRPNSAAAPATVSGELVPQCHWDKPGKAVPGAALAVATIRAAENSGIAVEPLRCLANCKRGCTAVLRRTDPSAPAWTYVFGHLDPAADAQALVQGAKLLAGSADGLMPWRGRPDALKRGLIARVPPFDFSEQRE